MGQIFRSLIFVGLMVATVAIVWQWRNTVDLEEFYKGKRVILTGASRGIGKALAIQLAQLGAKVVVGARSVEKLSQTQKECQRYTSHVHTVIGDISNETVCMAMVDKAVEEFGGIDILILNAALTDKEPKNFVDIEKPGEVFSQYYGVSVLQAVYLVHHALPYLNSSQGYIVPVSSASAIVGIPKISPYTASKNALQGFFKVLNQEFIMTTTRVSITIMPLPYVLTDTSKDMWKPREGKRDGITSEFTMMAMDSLMMASTFTQLMKSDCADRMLQGIPQRRLWYFVDWSSFIIGHLYSLCPAFFDWGVRMYMPVMSHLF